MLYSCLPLLSLLFVIMQLISSSTVILISNVLAVSGITFYYRQKRVRGMIKTYSQMHCTGKHLQHSSINLLVWLNVLVFVYELSGCRIEYCCNHINLKHIFPTFPQKWFANQKNKINKKWFGFYDLSCFLYI